MKGKIKMNKIFMEEKINNQSVSKTILSVTVTLLVIGAGLYLLLQSSWLHYIFAHLGAIGLVTDVTQRALFSKTELAAKISTVRTQS